MQLDTITDMFCGCGGSSLGASMAGAQLRLGLNHWPLAIETHNANFPQADHDCTDVSACDPRRYPSTGILIASPECTNHSLAKGKARKMQAQLEMFGRVDLDPAEERSRATMWDVVRFAEYHRYRVVIVENVVDARMWAPFPAWLQAMELLGYQYRCVYLNSMHAHPTPQSRDRMYVVFWQRSQRAPNLDFHPLAHCPKCARDIASVQSWKNPQKPWGKYKQQYLYRCPSCAGEVTPYYYAAANAIDWQIPAPRIGDRKRPLQEKTLRRIQIGLEKYGNQDLIVANYSPGWTKPASTGALGAITTADHHALLTVPPFIVKLKGNENGERLDRALSTVTAGGINHALAIPPYLISYYGNSDATNITDPIGTQTTRERNALIIPPFLLGYYTRLTGQEAALSSMDEPTPTMPARPLHYLVEPGAIPSVEDCGFRMLQPHEIQRAMAFPDEYEVRGNQRDKVKQLGNAVTPPVMQMLVSRVLESLN